LEDAKAYFMKYYNNSVENYIDYNGKGEILYRCTLDDGTDVTLRLTSKGGVQPSILLIRINTTSWLSTFTLKGNTKMGQIN
jgi:hypothetical protein